MPAGKIQGLLYIYNMFCLPWQIKFLKTKEGSAMIQMGDGLAVERCVQYLNNAPLFGPDSLLQLGFSKQPFLAEVPNPFTLPDGTPSFKDFIGCKHNRFTSPAMSIKNRIQGPSKVRPLFFVLKLAPAVPRTIVREGLRQVAMKRPNFRSSKITLNRNNGLCIIFFRLIMVSCISVLLFSDSALF